MGRLLADLAVQTRRWSITPTFRENQVKVVCSENEGGQALVVTQCEAYGPVNRDNALLFPISETGQVFQIESNLWTDRALALSVVPRDYQDDTAACRVVVEVETVVKPSSGVCNMPLYNPPPTAQWIEAQLAAGWINFGGIYPNAAYIKDGSTVHLRGAVQNVGGGTTTILTLPEGYRPSVVLNFIVTTYSSFVTPGNVQVYPDGTVVYADLGGTVFFGLDGVVFHL